MTDDQSKKELSTAVAVAVAGNSNGGNGCGNNGDNGDDEFNQNLERFKIVLEARNFEIDMFWRRCNHFWLFNISVGAGAGVSFLNEEIPLLFLISVVSIFSSFAWIKIFMDGNYLLDRWDAAVANLQGGIGFEQQNETNFFNRPGNAQDAASKWMLKIAIASFIFWANAVIGAFYVISTLCLWPFACETP